MLAGSAEDLEDRLKAEEGRVTKAISIELPPVEITEENALKLLPEGKCVKVSRVIEEFHITQLRDVRRLESTVNNLVEKGFIEKIKKDGATFYKKK